MKTRNKYTEADRVKAIDCYKKYKEQLSLKEISIKAGVPYFTLYNWLKVKGIDIMSSKEYETRFNICNECIEYAKSNDSCDLNSASRTHNISLKTLKLWLKNSGLSKFIVGTTLYSREFVDDLLYKHTVEAKTVLEIAEIVKLHSCTVGILIQKHKHTKHITPSGTELSEAIKADSTINQPINYFTNVKTEDIDTVNILRTKLDDIKKQITTLQEQTKSIEHTIEILSFKE